MFCLIGDKTTQPNEVWLTYVDQTDGCDRESWSVFYTKPTVTLSEAAAQQAGKDEIAALCAGDPDMDPAEYTAHVVGPLEIK